MRRICADKTGESEAKLWDPIRLIASKIFCSHSQMASSNNNFDLWLKIYMHIWGNQFTTQPDKSESNAQVRCYTKRVVQRMGFGERCLHFMGSESCDKVQSQ